MMFNGLNNKPNAQKAASKVNIEEVNERPEMQQTNQYKNKMNKLLRMTMRNTCGSPLHPCGTQTRHGER